MMRLTDVQIDEEDEEEEGDGRFYTWNSGRRSWAEIVQGTLLRPLFS